MAWSNVGSKTIAVGIKKERRQCRKTGLFSFWIVSIMAFFVVDKRAHELSFFAGLTYRIVSPSKETFSPRLSRKRKYISGITQ